MALSLSNKKTVIKNIAREVQKKFKNETTGHDWWHIYRVWKMAKRIAEKEGGDMLVVELAALLHDIADWKFHAGDDTVGPRVARGILKTHDISSNIIDHVCEIISGVTFKGAGVKTPMRTIEGEIVQDADRLDALGAVGVARAFAYGGYKHRPLYDPRQKPVFHRTKKAYITSKGTTINHFYEKLLLLKNRLNTQTAKRIAAQRHIFMEEYLKQFFAEWEGDR